MELRRIREWSLAAGGDAGEISLGDETDSTCPGIGPSSEVTFTPTAFDICEEGWLIVSRQANRYGGTVGPMEQGRLAG